MPTAMMTRLSRQALDDIAVEGLRRKIGSVLIHRQLESSHEYAIRPEARIDSEHLLIAAQKCAAGGEQNQRYPNFRGNECRAKPRMTPTNRSAAA